MQAEKITNLKIEEKDLQQWSASLAIRALNNINLYIFHVEGNMKTKVRGGKGWRGEGSKAHYFRSTMPPMTIDIIMMMRRQHQ